MNFVVAIQFVRHISQDFCLQRIAQLTQLAVNAFMVYATASLADVTMAGRGQPVQKQSIALMLVDVDNMVSVLWAEHVNVKFHGLDLHAL